jgi:hypothetical protein
MKRQIPLKIVGNVDNSLEMENCVLLCDSLPPYAIDFQCDRLGNLRFDNAGELFENCRQLRLFLEEENWQLLCNAARPNIWASNLSRQSAGGWRAYLCTIGEQVSFDRLTDIFGEVSYDEIASVEEQDRFHQLWVESIRGI